jgi:hypothetical protein
MIPVAASVENDPSHAFGQGTLGQHFAHGTSLGFLVQSLDLLLYLDVRRRGGHKRMPNLVIYNLRIDVPQATKDIQPRARLRSRQPFTHATMATLACNDAFFTHLVPTLT